MAVRSSMAVAVGDLVQPQGQVEHLARVDRAEPDPLDEVGQEQSYRASPPWRWTWAQNRSVPSSRTPWGTPT